MAWAPSSAHPHPGLPRGPGPGLSSAPPGQRLHEAGAALIRLLHPPSPSARPPRSRRSVTAGWQRGPGTGGRARGGAVHPPEWPPRASPGISRGRGRFACIRKQVLLTSRISVFLISAGGPVASHPLPRWPGAQVSQAGQTAGDARVLGAGLAAVRPGREKGPGWVAGSSRQLPGASGEGVPGRAGRWLCGCVGPGIQPPVLLPGWLCLGPAAARGREI